MKRVIFIAMMLLTMTSTYSQDALGKSYYEVNQAYSKFIESRLILNSGQKAITGTIYNNGLSYEVMFIFDIITNECNTQFIIPMNDYTDMSIYNVIDSENVYVKPNTWDCSKSIIVRDYSKMDNSYFYMFIAK